MRWVKRGLVLAGLVLAGCAPYDPGAALIRALDQTTFFPTYYARPVCDKHGCWVR